MVSCISVLLVLEEWVADVRGVGEGGGERVRFEVACACCIAGKDISGLFLARGRKDVNICRHVDISMPLYIYIIPSISSISSIESASECMQCNGSCRLPAVVVEGAWVALCAQLQAAAAAGGGREGGRREGEPGSLAKADVREAEAAEEYHDEILSFLLYFCVCKFLIFFSNSNGIIFCISDAPQL